MRQTGLASVELVLLMPVLLAMIVLLFAIAGAFRTKFDTLEAARLAAWRYATGTETWLDRVPFETTFRGDPMLVDAGSLELEPSANLLERMRARGRRTFRDTDRLTAVLKAEGATGSLGEAQAFFAPAQRLDSWSVFVSSTHALVTGPAWEGRTMPIGYDNYLRRRLNSRVVMPTMFPCAGGADDSGAARCR